MVPLAKLWGLDLCEWRCFPVAFVSDKSTSPSAVSSANSFLYDPSTNAWSGTGKLKQAGSHTLTRLSNGQVLAVGGSDAELYTP